jgi:hypothetical protein
VEEKFHIFLTLTSGVGENSLSQSGYFNLHEVVLGVNGIWNMMGTTIKCKGKNTLYVQKIRTSAIQPLSSHSVDQITML